MCGERRQSLSVAWWRCTGGHAASDRYFVGSPRPLTQTLCSPPPAIPTQRCCRIYLPLKVTRVNETPGPRTINPKASPVPPKPGWQSPSPNLGPQRKRKDILRPGNCCIHSNLGTWWGEFGGSLAYLRPPQLSWPQSPLMELTCDLLISPEQIRL